MGEHHDTVVIGGGQAGLAMSVVLRQCGREHVVLERRQVGERWRSERWESLRFQFPNWSLELPGYGVTQVPELYFLGLHWMHTFTSGLLAGVGSDAEYLAEHMDLMTGP